MTLMRAIRSLPLQLVSEGWLLVEILRGSLLTGEGFVASFWLWLTSHLQLQYTMYRGKISASKRADDFVRSLALALLFVQCIRSFEHTIDKSYHPDFDGDARFITYLLTAIALLALLFETFLPASDPLAALEVDDRMVDEDMYAALLKQVGNNENLLQKLQRFNVAKSFAVETRSYLRDCCALTPWCVDSSPKLKQFLDEGDVDEASPAALKRRAAAGVARTVGT